MAENCSKSSLETVEWFDVRQNGIHEEGIRALVSALKHNRNLRHLWLEDNAVLPKGAKALARALESWPELEVLNLSDCLIRDAGCNYIIDHLNPQLHRHLKNVYLCGNELTPPVAKRLIEFQFCIKTFQNFPIFIQKWSKFNDFTSKPFLHILTNSFSAEFDDVARMAPDNVRFGDEEDDLGSLDGDEEVYNSKSSDSDDVDVENADVPIVESNLDLMKSVMNAQKPLIILSLYSYDEELQWPTKWFDLSPLLRILQKHVTIIIYVTKSKPKRSKLHNHFKISTVVNGKLVSEQTQKDILSTVFSVVESMVDFRTYSKIMSAAENLCEKRMTSLKEFPRFPSTRFTGIGVSGSFHDQMIYAYDVQNQRRVLMKPFLLDTESNSRRTLRELKLLSNFRHAHVVSIEEFVGSETVGSLKDIYIVQCLMETDLYKLLKTHKLSNYEVCYFLYQILCGIKYIHSANVLHRDLRPSNLQLSGKNLKISGFKYACVMSPQLQPKSLLELTEKNTCWYTAPEILLDSKEYTEANDIWSVGCIFAELFKNRPIFPGQDQLDQLNMILAVVGAPSNEDLQCIINDKARCYLISLPHKPKQPWSRLYPGADPRALDLLDKMLKFNPPNRIITDHALANTYLQDHSNPANETNSKIKFGPKMEYNDVSKERLKELIWEEAEALHKRVMAEQARNAGAPNV
ncbi:hypothetical protein B9Z55_011554 [Caenorhabditis nigoni]|uniref:Protein kinase domain-containing protein n=1 Tax=Caenorhabditis nigoni TaxID=1611254 RepID=A0A2G5UKK6_9PELO|nr:hypothetical protein B9Z55_011554 [Caenorhabditis nigoni]